MDLVADQPTHTPVQPRCCRALLLFDNFLFSFIILLVAILFNQKQLIPRRPYRMAGDPNKKAVEGIVIEAMPSATFKVRVAEDKEIHAYLSGKMRVHYIKVLPGDRVLVELSPDGDKGRIIRRL